MSKRTHVSGFSLIELMIAITVALILSVAVMYIYGGQVRTFSQIARKEQTGQEARSAFEILNSLVRQAEVCLAASCTPQQTIAITYPGAISNPNATTTLQTSNDSVQIDFTVPSGYYIWPNDTSPYTNNAIRIEWSSTDNIVYVSAGASLTDTAASRTRIPLAGASGGMNTKIVNLDLWPQIVSATGVISDAAGVTDKSTAGYRLAMTARVGTADSTYTNRLDPNGPLKSYRTVTYQRAIIPRNW
jgi:prepilin-type N-terminal cleavage/methylation domain-containing protein